MTKPAPAPSKVDRQPRIAPTPTTVITISMISTAEARNEVAKTDVSIMGRPYRDVRTTFRQTQSPWIQIARRVSRQTPPRRRADPDHHQQAHVVLLQPDLEVDPVDPAVDVVGPGQ